MKIPSTLCMYVCTLLVNFQDFFTCHSAKIYLVTRTTHQHDGEITFLALLSEFRDAHLEQE